MGIVGVCHIRRMRQWRKSELSAEPFVSPGTAHAGGEYRTIDRDGEGNPSWEAKLDNTSRDTASGELEGGGRQSSSDAAREQSGWGLLALPYRAVASAYRAVTG